jgi:cytochrome c oxidase subunit II
VARRTAQSRTARIRRTLRVTLVLGLVAVSASACSVDDLPRFGWPRGITPQAERMRHLWSASVIAALAVGVVVWGLIFYSVIRFRKRGDNPPPQVRFNMPIEILYTVLPFLIIAVLFYYTAIDENYVNKESKNPDVQVSVVGFKWNWQFLYNEVHGADGANVPVRDSDGEFLKTVGSTTEVPVLVLPAHRKIRFVETSDDVIHSFWVPAFLFKRDVIPGRINSFEVTIDRTGAFVGRCAEYCGTYHSRMNFEVRVVSESDFETFLAAKAAGSTTADALGKIGQPKYAVTTHPFVSDRTARTPGS